MKILHNLFLLISIGVVSGAQANTSELLRNTEKALSERARYAESIIEKRTSSLAKIASFAQLQKEIGTTWRHDLPLISKVASSDNAQALYFKAAQVLPREEYIQFMMLASEQVAGNGISKQQFKWGVFPSEKHLREMWTDSTSSESLKILAQRAKQLLDDDPSTLQFFDNVIVGRVASDNRPSGQSSTSVSDTPTTQPAPSESLSVLKVQPILASSKQPSAPWLWIIGILLLAVINGILFKFLRKK
jgi:hypothetical protein